MHTKAEVLESNNIVLLQYIGNRKVYESRLLPMRTKAKVLKAIIPCCHSTYEGRARPVSLCGPFIWPDFEKS